MPTRVARYLAESAEHPGGPGCCLQATEACFKATCAVLLLGGLTASGWAWGELQGHTQGLLLARTDPAAPAWLNTAVLGIGLAIALTASCGLWAVSSRSISLLNTHLIVLSFLLSAQLCLIVTLQTRSSGGLNAHEPQSAATDKDLSILDYDERVVKTVVTGVGVGLQVLNLVIACALQTAYNQIDEAAQDLDEEVSTRRPLLPPSLPQRLPAHTGGQEDPAALEWRTRMQERYGLDTRQFTYDPSGGSARQDSAPRLGRSRAANADTRSGCVVM